MIGRQQSAYTCVIFFSFCILGTLLHESGHCLAAIIVGYTPRLHYGYTEFIRQPGSLNYSNATSDYIFMLAAGPIVNIVIGTIGFCLLYRSSERSSGGLVIFLAALTFFWSREIVVFVTDVFVKLFASDLRSSDEQKISKLVNIPVDSVSIILGVIGIIFCAITVLKYLPKTIQRPFIIWGGIGSLLGYIFWFNLLGPILLP